MVVDAVKIVAGLGLMALFAVSSLEMGLLDFMGFIAALAVGCTVFVSGGWGWLIPLMVFYLSAGAATRYRYKEKRVQGLAEEERERSGRRSARSWGNVLANGGLPFILAVAELFLGDHILFIGFLGAVSVSTSDTLATEIGLLNRYKPRLITDLDRRVAAGTSGGVTVLGEAAGLLGASVMGFTAWLIDGGLPLKEALLSTIVAGLIGCNVDSLLGATIQAVYRCPACGERTEERRHCGQPTIHVKGRRIIGNNTVNLLSTIFGTAAAVLTFVLLHI